MKTQHQRLINLLFPNPSSNITTPTISLKKLMKSWCTYFLGLGTELPFLDSKKKLSIFGVTPVVEENMKIHTNTFLTKFKAKSPGACPVALSCMLPTLTPALLSSHRSTGLHQAFCTKNIQVRPKFLIPATPGTSRNNQITKGQRKNEINKSHGNLPSSEHNHPTTANRIS
ncbi:uncharacterized protein LOC143442434 [Arvicanthis niloticus]|uniref:uncharacterized protein LOC143442434 n=1 Tax=Arvicanthis niloticus TaxID=61156 RepID=UPI00403D16FC